MSAPDRPQIAARAGRFLAPASPGEEVRLALAPGTGEATIHVLARRALARADLALVVTPPARRADVVATRRGALVRLVPEPGAACEIAVGAPGAEIAGLLVRTLPAGAAPAPRAELLATPLGPLAARLSPPIAGTVTPEDVLAAMAAGAEAEEAARLLSRSFDPHLAARPALAAHAAALLATLADAEIATPAALGPLLMLMARE